jgi:hypothetical protein
MSRPKINLLGLPTTQDLADLQDFITKYNPPEEIIDVVQSMIVLRQHLAILLLSSKQRGNIAKRISKLIRKIKIMLDDTQDYLNDQGFIFNELR